MVVRLLLNVSYSESRLSMHKNDLGYAVRDIVSFRKWAGINRNIISKTSPNFLL